MVNISSVGKTINLLVRNTSGSFVHKPISRPIAVSDLKNLKYAGDTFTTTTKRRVSIDEVKALFGNGRIKAAYMRRKMYKVKKDLLLNSFTSVKEFKKWLHSTNLSSKLSENDYKEVVDFMNLHNGKYIDVWKGSCPQDNVQNLQKLALFIRSIQRIDKLNFYKSLKLFDWHTCVEGIINRPKQVIKPLLQYKYDSRKINNAIGSDKGSENTKKQIKIIEEFLDTQTIKYDIQAYRGEGDFGLFSTIKLGKDKTLKNVIEKYTEEIKAGKRTDVEIDEFITKYLLADVTQKRFLSTAIEKEAAERYAKKIFWHLNIPKGAKGSMIECYNVERASEAELLLQRNSRLIIDNAKYDRDKNIWELWATVKQ